MLAGISRFALFALLSGVIVMGAYSGETEDEKEQLAVTATGAIVRLRDDGTYVLEAPCEMSVNRALNDREHELWSHHEVERHLRGRRPQQLDFSQARNILRTWTFRSREKHREIFRSTAFRDMVEVLWEEESDDEEAEKVEEKESEEETVEKREKSPDRDGARRLMTGVPAIRMVGEGTGEVVIEKDRYYPTFSHWDDPGHWLEWEVRIPADGVYMPVFIYATDAGPVYRGLAIDGSVAVERFEFPDTGGWGREQWQWHVERIERKLRLRSGVRRVRMINLPPGGGLNLAWILFVSPDVSRDAILQRVEQQR